MKSSLNTKKLRAVIVTIVLVAATNFAISHAESVTAVNRSGAEATVLTMEQIHSFASGEVSLPPGPRPTTSFASGQVSLPPGPRPTLSLPSNKTGLSPLAKSFELFASAQVNLPTGPRPTGL